MSVRIRAPFLLFLILILAAGGGYGYWAYFEGNPPVVQVSPDVDLASGRTLFTVNVKDSNPGLRSVVVSVANADTKEVLLQKDFAAPSKEWSGTFQIKNRKFRKGKVRLSVVCTDSSYRDWGKGNRAVWARTINMDNEAPRISTISHHHNLNHGGSGLAVYRLSEDAVKTGVKVGKYFFPAYPDDRENYFCFFAFPEDADPDNDIPKIVAVDEAGNEREGGFYYHIKSKGFKSDTIKISDKFLNAKMPQFEDEYPDATTPLEIFLNVNRTTRKKNRAMLKDFGRQTTPEVQWEKRFVRQPAAANRATFGDRRSYFYNGKKVDSQTHLGVDLASVAQAKVVAGNSGTVIFAEFLGIWGQVVIIDHGLGLQSLYAHLSQMNVKPGQHVKRGEVIGRTGATGLAGGDHLHFGMLVSGVPVNPIEWWDGHWIKNNISSKLKVPENSNQ